MKMLFQRLAPRLIVITIPFIVAACTATPPPYKAYPGEVRSVEQLALITGTRYSRQDWLNRYTDKIRFSSVDGQTIENNESIDDILVTPGTHEIVVYFSWDTGSQRGLAPALVDYASSDKTLSRTLRFNTSAGRQYYVRGNPSFIPNGTPDITELTHVDFWVEDDFGNMVVSREQGRYVPTN